MLRVTFPKGSRASTLVPPLIFRHSILSMIPTSVWMPCEGEYDTSPSHAQGPVYPSTHDHTSGSVGCCSGRVARRGHAVMPSCSMIVKAAFTRAVMLANCPSRSHSMYRCSSLNMTKPPSKNPRIQSVLNKRCDALLHRIKVHGALLLVPLSGVQRNLNGDWQRDVAAYHDTSSLCLRLRV